MYLQLLAYRCTVQKITESSELGMTIRARHFTVSLKTDARASISLSIPAQLTGNWCNVSNPMLPRVTSNQHRRIMLRDLLAQKTFVFRFKETKKIVIILAHTGQQPNSNVYVCSVVCLQLLEINCLS